MKYRIKERVFLINNFFKSADMKTLLRAGRAEHPKQPLLSHYTIKNTVSNYEKYGTYGP